VIQTGLMTEGISSIDKAAVEFSVPISIPSTWESGYTTTVHLSVQAQDDKYPEDINNTLDIDAGGMPDGPVDWKIKIKYFETEEQNDDPIWSANYQNKRSNGWLDTGLFLDLCRKYTMVPEVSGQICLYDRVPITDDDDAFLNDCHCYVIPQKTPCGDFGICPLDDYYLGAPIYRLVVDNQATDPFLEGEFDNLYRFVDEPGELQIKLNTPSQLCSYQTPSGQVIESQIKMSYKLYYDNSGPVPPKNYYEFSVDTEDVNWLTLPFFVVEDPADTLELHVDCSDQAVLGWDCYCRCFFENARPDGENSWYYCGPDCPQPHLPLGSLVYSIGNSEKVRYMGCGISLADYYGETGQVKLKVNDFNYEDNEGEYVIIAYHWPCRFGNTLVTNTESKTKGSSEPKWIPSKTYVEEGDLLTVFASGYIEVDQDNTRVGPEGILGLFCGETCPLDESPRGMLLGKIGSDGPLFPVGAKFIDMPVHRTGRLFLAINDFDYSDNQGAFLVHGHAIPAPGDDDDDDTHDDPWQWLPEPLVIISDDDDNDVSDDDSNDDDASDDDLSDDDNNDNNDDNDDNNDDNDDDDCFSGCSCESASSIPKRAFRQDEITGIIKMEWMNQPETEFAACFLLKTGLMDMMPPQWKKILIGAGALNCSQISDNELFCRVLNENLRIEISGQEMKAGDELCSFLLRYG